MRKIELQNKSGRIAVQFTTGGQRYSLYGLGDYNSHSDKAKAESLVRVIEADILEHCFDTTLDKYKQGLGKAVKRLGTPVEMFTIWVESLKISQKTFKVHYEPVLKAIIATHGKTMSGDNIANHWKHLKPSSYNGRIGYLKRFGAWLVSEGYLPLNPYRALKPKQGDRATITPFTAEQVTQVIATLYERNDMVGAYYEFLFLTGCRPAEAIGLLKEKMNPVKGELTIDSVLARGDDGSATAQGRVRKGTKTGDVRVLPLSVPLSLCIVKALGYQQSSGINSVLIFCNRHGHALDDTNLCDRHWKPALEACGIPYQRPYITRHTAASTVIENGGTLADAAKLLGHSDLRMVSSIYGKAVKGVQLPSYSEPSD